MTLLNSVERPLARALLLTGALILAAAAALVPGSAAITNRNLSFDGGVNAQVARNLAEKHRYATSYRGLRDFEHRIQTGPTVIVPTAVAFRLFGVNSTTAQLTNLVYLVTLFLLAVLLSWRLSGPLAAYLAIPVLLATPRLFDLGLRLYGELPALVFLLAGLLLFHRHSLRPTRWTALLAGASLGLAFLTKFQMLLPVSVVAVIAWAFHTPGKRSSRFHKTLACGGFLAVLLPIEIAKLQVLSFPTYLQWWRIMLGRSLAQGTSFRMSHTVTGIDKPLVHLEILAKKMSLPPTLAILFVVLPPLLLALLLWCRRRSDTPSGRAQTVTLTALAGAGVSLAAWWLVLSPTSHTWLRRIFDGLMLLEILGVIVLVDLAAILWSGEQDERHCALPRPLPYWVVPAALILLAQVYSVLAWTRIPSLDRQVSPSRARAATEAMVSAINALPKDATIYAKGWYEAPLLAALTGRYFLDLDQFPIDRYRTPLEKSYFIADAAMMGNRPEEAAGVLARAGAVLLRRTGSNYLYQLTTICPYTPIPRPPQPDDLLTMFHPEEDSYPYCAGIRKRGLLPSQARAVCGVLLARTVQPFFLVDLHLSMRAGPHPEVVVRLDGREVLHETARGGRPFRRFVVLPPPLTPGANLSAVEIAVHRDGGAPRFFLSDSDWGMFSLHSVGFAKTRSTAMEDGKDP